MPAAVVAAACLMNSLRSICLFIFSPEKKNHGKAEACFLSPPSSPQSILAKSGQVKLGHRYSTARVSKRPTDESAACLRARYCTDLAWLDLERNPCAKAQPTRATKTSEGCSPGDLTKVRASDAGIRITEIRMVKSIENIHPDFSANALSEL